MRIVKLEKISGKKDTFKVFFDDGGNILLAADIIVRFGLNAGVEISDETYKEVVSADKTYRVIFDALTLAGRRSYSQKALYEKLLQKGYDDENSKAAVQRLKELDYINDEKYALAYAKYLSDKGKAELIARKELEEKGISKDLINKTLLSLKTQEEPYKQILKTIQIKFKSFNADDRAQVRRMANYFLRRGFLSEDISKALRRYADDDI
ncbi:MAG: recombination regulator RecX [Endomicrobium sp.]|jgi:regulatory protein|nr:recombination regulator RecX [Endomicrobium sp.]